MGVIGGCPVLPFPKEHPMSLAPDTTTVPLPTDAGSSCTVCAAPMQAGERAWICWVDPFHG